MPDIAKARDFAAMEPFRITKTEARRYLLAKQGLIGSYRFAGKEGALSYVRQAGCIQFDPVDVCGKNAELTLQSRVKGFRRKMLQDLLYTDRKLVDYTDKELSIWPAEDWPYFASYRQKSYDYGRQFDGLSGLEETALSYIREHGPVSSDSLPIDGSIFWHSYIHWSGNWHKESAAARSVLEQMYTDGRLVIHHKTGSRKFYDLAEKHLPEELLKAENPCPEEMDHLKWRILRRIGAVGMLCNRRSDAFLGIPMTTEQRDRAFSELLDEGKIREVIMEDFRSPLYIPAGDMDLLRSVKEGRADLRARCEFLAPLDPFLWDRKLIREIYDFQYSWEIYTPADKRKYGYYVLPVIYGDSFAGRIEASADRAAGVLTVKNFWPEEGIRRTKRMESAAGSAVKRLAVLNGCKEIQGADELF